MYVAIQRQKATNLHEKRYTTKIALIHKNSTFFQLTFRRVKYLFLHTFFKEHKLKTTQNQL